jgi:hypothetical protein
MLAGRETLHSHRLMLTCSLMLPVTAHTEQCHWMIQQATARNLALLLLLLYHTQQARPSS